MSDHKRHVQRRRVVSHRVLQLAAETSGVTGIAIRRWSKPAMPGVVSVYLPTWPIDRYRRMLGQQAPPADQPLAMIARDGSRRLVVAANSAAFAAGLRIGTPASKARAPVADLIVEELRPKEDREELDRLASGSCATSRRSSQWTRPTASSSIRPGPITWDRRTTAML